MENDKTTKQTKKKKTVTKKTANAGTKKKKTAKKASKKTQKSIDNRKSELRKEERETIYKQLVGHFGATKIDEVLSNCKYKKDQDPILLQWKKKLEQELEDERRSVEEYYKTIDAEWKTVGRPKSVLNWKEFEYLCSIGCTLDEIAGFFQVCKRTLQEKVKEEFGETFTERYEKLSQGMKVSLRRRQFQVAMEGDTNMLKFLGKNVLGQRDKLDFEGEVKVNSWVDLMNNLENDENSAPD